jgi:hypothetical protein
MHWQLILNSFALHLVSEHPQELHEVILDIDDPSDFLIHHRELII